MQVEELTDEQLKRLFVARMELPQKWKNKIDAYNKAACRALLKAHDVLREAAQEDGGRCYNGPLSVMWDRHCNKIFPPIGPVNDFCNMLKEDLVDAYNKKFKTEDILKIIKDGDHE